jgi:rhomboid protease GluP
MNDSTPSQEPNSTETPQAQNNQRVAVRMNIRVKYPTITYVLLGVSILIYLLQILSETSLGIDLPAVIGVKSNELILQGQLWRLITPVFLHGSVLHLAFNMYALFAIGRSLEKQYGHLRFALLYFLAGFSGNLCSFYLSNSNSLGSSTAIFGLIAAEIVFILQNRYLFGQRAKSILINMLIIVAGNLLIGTTGGIDNWGHVGGLVGGLAFAWFSGPLLKIKTTKLGYELVDTRSKRTVLLTTLGVLITCVGLVGLQFLIR